VGESVSIECSTNAPPAMTGGPIADGTYALTGQTIYNTDCGSAVASLPAETLVIAGACAQVVVGLGPDAGHSSVALASRAETLTLGQVCPTTGEGSYGYTSANGSLTLLSLDPTGVVTVSAYTRQ
jgi:hypothetical protein